MSDRRRDRGWLGVLDRGPLEFPVITQPIVRNAEFAGHGTCRVTDLSCRRKPGANVICALARLLDEANRRAADVQIHLTN